MFFLEGHLLSQIRQQYKHYSPKRSSTTTPVQHLEENYPGRRPDQSYSLGYTNSSTTINLQFIFHLNLGNHMTSDLIGEGRNMGGRNKTELDVKYLFSTQLFPLLVSPPLVLTVTPQIGHTS